MAVPEELRANTVRLCQALEWCRAHLFGGSVIHVNSGYRTPAFNQAIGGAKHSQHMLAAAADVTVAGHSPLEVQQLVTQAVAAGALALGGIGSYETFTHFDVGPAGRRWRG